jgi:hypothetical protein
LHGVAGFVPQNPETVALGAALDLENHLALKPHEAGMGEVKRNRNAGRALGAKPLVGNPGMRPQQQASVGELVVKLMKLILEPSALDGDAKVLEPQLQKLFVWERRPGKSAPGTRR